MPSECGSVRSAWETGVGRLRDEPVSLEKSSRLCSSTGAPPRGGQKAEWRPARTGHTFVLVTLSQVSVSWVMRAVHAVTSCAKSEFSFSPACRRAQASSRQGRGRDVRCWRTAPLTGRRAERTLGRSGRLFRWGLQSPGGHEAASCAQLPVPQALAGQRTPLPTKPGATAPEATEPVWKRSKGKYSLL